MNVLVTGGTGFIGSHTVVTLVEAGHRVVIVDNFANSSPRVLPRLAELTGTEIPFERLDVRDVPALLAVMREHAVDAVIHFAAFKAVGESCEHPIDYFDNNVGGTIAVLRAMVESGCRRLVFSSSATVYGNPENCPIPEDAPLGAVNPYGRTKLVMEQLIGDVLASQSGFQAAILRYFNPVGAHASGRIGEDPRGTPNNLMPFMCQIAVGKRPKLSVYGSDYPTPDGTGVRDYVHVVDLAEAHVAALEYLERESSSVTVNIGTGKGHSVLELLRTFERASGRTIPYELAPRRPGDAASAYADPTLAGQLLGWTASRDLEKMCRDAWNWQQANPDGYEG